MILMKRKTVVFPLRGVVWWVSFDPSLGTEAKKTRPAVVISNDIANEFLERVQVAPLTSSTARVYPSEALVTMRGKKNEAAADQIATVSKKRLYKKIGHVSDTELGDIAYAIKVQLGMV